MGGRGGLPAVFGRIKVSELTERGVLRGLGDDGGQGRKGRGGCTSIS